MSAIRVIDDHVELENVGSITHQEIDQYIDRSLWLIASGTGPVPSSSYVLEPGGGISFIYEPGRLVISSSIEPAPPATVTTTVTWKFMETPLGAVDDYNTQFLLDQNPYPPESLMLFVNGVLQVKDVTADYVLSGNLVTMTQPLVEGSKISATYSHTAVGENIAWSEKPVGVMDGVNIVFELSHKPVPAASLMLFVNGILQSQDIDYSLEDSVITFFDAPVQDTNISATYRY